MLVDNIIKYYDPKRYDLNCAETLLYAANEAYDLGLDEKAFKTMAAFGGGMAVEGVCGALTGALAVLGILYTDGRAHNSPRLKDFTTDYIARFEQELGTSNCKELKQLYRNEETRCGRIVEKAAEILEDIILNNKYIL